MYRHAKIGTFFQSKPKLANTYRNDGFLQRVLRRFIPAELFSDIDKDLTRLGQRCATDIEYHGDQVEENQPYLKQFDAWGNRIDDVVTHPSWMTLKDIAAEEGLVSIGYERKHGELSRLYQYAKIYLYSPSSGLWSCPLAMTDGAAKILTDLKNPKFDEPLSRLTSRDPRLFWSSGQWMTERRGGSDVANGTETVAVPVSPSEGNVKYKLHGYKWFTSATDANVSLTLARIQQNADGGTIAGSAGLSMFYLETRKEDGSLNNMQIMKLKNKLGTRQLPTGELLLDGTEAQLLSEPGRGVATISGMLSVTRLHNAVASIGSMRRILSLLRDYSMKRDCFGQKISTMGLHLNTMARLEVATRGGTLFVMELARLFGRVEVLGDEADAAVFRILTPIGKLYFGKLCMGVISEGVEGFGGNGYIEDTGIPRILRDAQVTPIWEGTTNILSLDVLRAIAKTKGEVLLILNEYIWAKLDDSSSGSKLKALVKDVQDIITAGQVNPTIAREFSFALAEITVGALLLEHARSDIANHSDHLTAQLWISQLVPLSHRLRNQLTDTRDMAELVYDSYVEA